jgi:hypothetical protein
VRRMLVAATLAALLAPCPAAIAHEGNPNFSSTVRRIVPTAQGLSIDVLNGDDRLLMTNRSDRTVVVVGYEREPYARLAPDGTVEVNRRSPAAHINEERFGGVEVPAAADARAAPRWEVVGRTGRFEWHDHRMHWMGRGTPPQVADESVRTKVFDWSIPLRVDDRRGAIAGTLTWVPTPGGAPPVAAIAGLGAIVLAGGAVVVLVRRRRAGPRAARTTSEAW